MHTIKRFITYLQVNPAQMLGFSFAGLILFGTILLTLPVATTNGHGASLLTALFTATSATCVTGLIVEETGSYFTIFGQLIILFLIQLGGLGIMTFSTSLAIMFGKRLGVKERAVMQEILEAPDPASLFRIVLYIVKMTFLFELIGAVILCIRFNSMYHNLIQASYYAIFHAISAFCNAGFSLFPDSMVVFHSDIVVNCTIAALIVAGGIGFFVVASLIHRDYLSMGLRHIVSELDIHSKLVLLTTAILIIGGMLIIFLFEYDHVLLPLSLKEKFLASFFQSITTRTAGFNTLEIGQFRNSTLFIMIVLMFIGAAPGSTGGGIKVSTVAVLLLSVKAMLLRRRNIEVFRRTVPQIVIYKSVTILVISLFVLALFFSFLLASQTGEFAGLLFEAVSAFGTVGLSVGVTPTLNVAGRLIIILLMFIGRIGPLTLAHAVGRQPKHSYYRYPEGSVMIG
jgi:trk system potassium uptake protein TrkH